MAKNKLRTISPNRPFIWHTFLGDYGGCGYIRVIYPSLYLNQYRYKGASFNTSYSQFFSGDPGLYKPLSFVKFQRSATEQHLKMVQGLVYDIGVKTNTKCFFEVDDLLSDDIPKTNNAHTYYKENWPYIKQMLGIVHGITVSTLPLANYMRQFNPNVSVTPNHLCKFLWGEYKGSKTKEMNKPRILYAGSMNHFPHKSFTDIEYGDMGKDVVEFIKKTTDKYQWVFVGGYPYQLETLIKDKKIEYHEWKMMVEFSSFMQSLKCDIMIAPLEQNFFNECKSNIKVLEACAMGIPGVYSDCYPYRGMKQLAENDEDFCARIEALAENPDLRTETVEHDYNIIKNQLFWEDNDNILKYIQQHFRLLGCKLG